MVSKPLDLHPTIADEKFVAALDVTMVRLPVLTEQKLEDVLGREDGLGDAVVGVVEGNLETISDGNKDDGKKGVDDVVGTSETFPRTSR